MRKLVIILTFATVILVCVSSYVIAVDIESLLNKEYLTSAEIIQYADILDGYKVTLRGEVVSESLERNGYCWINVYDNTNFISIGVMTNTNMIEKIEYWGNHRTTGDTIDVVGTVYRADPSADGELDMHADSISIVHSSLSGPRDVKIPLWKIITAVILFLSMTAVLGERFLNYLRHRNLKHEHVLEQYMDEI